MFWNSILDLRQILVYIETNFQSDIGVNGIPTEVGLFLGEDGKYYCAGPNGKLAVNQTYYVWMIHESAKDAYSNGRYFFDESGKLITE